MLNLLHLITNQERELNLGDFIKHTFNIGLWRHLWTDFVIILIGMVIHITKLQSLN